MRSLPNARVLFLALVITGSQQAAPRPSLRISVHANESRCSREWCGDSRQSVKGLEPSRITAVRRSGAGRGDRLLGDGANDLDWLQAGAALAPHLAGNGPENRLFRETPQSALNR